MAGVWVGALRFIVCWIVLLVLLIDFIDVFATVGLCGCVVWLVLSAQSYISY